MFKSDIPQYHTTDHPHLEAEHYASLVAQTMKNPPAMWDTWVWSLGQDDPLEKRMGTHSGILPGEFHGQRSLVGYSTWITKSQVWLMSNTFSFIICATVVSLVATCPELTLKSHFSLEIPWHTWNWIKCKNIHIKLKIKFICQVTIYPILVCYFIWNSREN